MSIASVRTGEAHDDFDPYLKWLGIEPHEHAPGKPPNHYRLLGINVYTSDPDVISNAADRQMSHVRTFQTGKRGDVSQAILTQIAAARICLLNPEKKAAYDQMLAGSGGVLVVQIGNQVRTAIEGNGKGPRVDTSSPSVKRPNPRQQGNGNGNGHAQGNGNGSPKAYPVVPHPVSPIPVPPVVQAPAAAPQPVSANNSPQPVETDPHWRFEPSAPPSAASAYKRKRNPTWSEWFQEHKGTAAAAIGGVVVAGTAGMYALFGGGGKPGLAESNNGAAVQPGENDTPKRPLQKTEFPRFEPEEPSTAQEVTPPPPPHQVAINVPPVTVDPAAEATRKAELERKAEEERKKAEEAKRQFDADVERATSEYRAKFTKVPAENLRQLAEQHAEDSVLRQALLRLSEEKMAYDTQCLDFQAEVEALYRSFTAPDSPYKDVPAAQLKVASQTEKNPATRAALCVLLAMRSGGTGNAYELHSALSEIRDNRFPGQKILAMETKILESHTGVPNKDMPAKSRLEMGRLALREARTAMAFDDYELAERLCNAADEYAKANSSIASIRDARERAALTEQARQLRVEINLGKQGVAQRKAMYASHMAGLDLTMEPKDPQASVRTGTFLIAAHGNWAQGMKYLQEGNDPLLAEASRLDLSVSSKSNAEAHYIAAMGWKAAADGNAGGNAAMWYARAAEWLLRAERSNPTGKLKLDVAVLRKELSEKTNVGAVTTTVLPVPEPGAPAAPEAFPQGEWVDLLKTKDLAANAQSGKWQIDATGLKAETVNGYDGMLLNLPLALKGSYEMEVTLKRNGAAGANVGITVGSSRTEVVVAEDTIGIGPIDGKRYSDNPTSVQFNRRLPEVYKVHVKVAELGGGNWSITVYVNDKPITQFQGHESKLSYPEGWGGERPFIGAWRPNGGNVHYQSVRIKMTGGQAELSSR